VKIGLVRRGYSPTGGAEAYLQRFAEAAVARGHECLLFAPNPWPKGEWPHGLHKIKHGRSPLEFALELVTSDPKRHCDVLFSLERVLECDCYRAGDGVHAAWLERRAQYEPRWKTWWRDRSDKHHELLKLEETMFKGESARAVIANSRMVRDEIVNRFGYPGDRVHVIYNGVPPPLSEDASAVAREEVRAELGLAEDAFVVIFAGSGWDRKGLKFAVTAMNDPVAAGATLLVAGSGNPKAMPKSDRVRYLGAVKGLGRHLAASDAFLLPTLYEPFSNACLEAMAAGLPVITSDSNGFAEIIQREADGSVIDDPSDTELLARLISEWAPAERRKKIREKLRQKGEVFSMEKNVDATLRLLESVRRPAAVAA
jgi:UDP-glucose:(heptosyl)LPS alpha-1,3-glucosyltransferase